MVRVALGTPGVTLRVVSALVGVLWVVYYLMMVEQSRSWTVARLRPVMVMLVVSTLRPLVIPGPWLCVG